MSYRAGLIRMAIRLTPAAVVIMVANRILKGVARLTYFKFDLDQRKLFVRTRLTGEPEAIDITLEAFSLHEEGGSYRFTLGRAHSNRPWMNNLLGRVVGRSWRLPDVPQIRSYLPLLAELLGSRKI